MSAWFSKVSLFLVGHHTSTDTWSKTKNPEEYLSKNPMRKHGHRRWGLPYSWEKLQLILDHWIITTADHKQPCIYCSTQQMTGNWLRSTISCNGQCMKARWLCCTCTTTMSKGESWAQSQQPHSYIHQCWRAKKRENPPLYREWCMLMGGRSRNVTFTWQWEVFLRTCGDAWTCILYHFKQEAWLTAGTFWTDQVGFNRGEMLHLALNPAI